MIMNRVWAMPNKNTFTIKPIYALLEKYEVGVGWIDPFAGNYSFAEYTNDFNPNTGAQSHESAEKYLEGFPCVFAGALLDPPYSQRQVVECYKKFGKGAFDGKWATTKFYSDIKDLLAGVIASGGYCISFGWNSIGLGKKRGFKIVEILLVSHGRMHNDTIVTVEVKDGGDREEISRQYY